MQPPSVPAPTRRPVNKLGIVRGQGRKVTDSAPVRPDASPPTAGAAAPRRRIRPSNQVRQQQKKGALLRGRESGPLRTQHLGNWHRHELRLIDDEAFDHALVLFGQQPASRIDQPSARLDQPARLPQDRLLDLVDARQFLLVEAPLQVGVAPQRAAARSRARRPAPDRSCPDSRFTRRSFSLAIAAGCTLDSPPRFSRGPRPPAGWHGCRRRRSARSTASGCQRQRLAARAGAEVDDRSRRGAAPPGARSAGCPRPAPRSCRPGTRPARQRRAFPTGGCPLASTASLRRAVAMLAVAARNSASTSSRCARCVLTRRSSGAGSVSAGEQRIGIRSGRRSAGTASRQLNRTASGARSMRLENAARTARSSFRSARGSSASAPCWRARVISAANLGARSGRAGCIIQRRLA